MFIRLGTLLIFLLTLCSCNNNSSSMVMPGTDGINRITIRSIDNTQSQMNKATLTAKLYCKRSRRTFLAIGSENFDADSLRQQQVYNENMQTNQMPNESYLEFTCK